MQTILDAIESSRRGDRPLPNAVYTSAEFLAYERDSLFSPSWFAIGFGADAPTP